MDVRFQALSRDGGDLALLAVRHLNCQTFYAKDYRGGGIPDVVFLPPYQFEAVVAGLLCCNRYERYTKVLLYTSPKKEAEKLFYVFAISDEGLVIPCTHFSSPENNDSLYRMAENNNTEWSPLRQIYHLGGVYIWKALLLVFVGSGMVFWSENLIVQLAGAALDGAITFSLIRAIFGGKWQHHRNQVRLSIIIGKKLAEHQRAGMKVISGGKK